MAGFTSSSAGPGGWAHTSTGRIHTFHGEKVEELTFLERGNYHKFCGELCDITKDFTTYTQGDDTYHVMFEVEKFKELCNDPKFRELVTIYCTE